MYKIIEIGQSIRPHDNIYRQILKKVKVTIDHMFLSNEIYNLNIGVKSISIIKIIGKEILD